MEETTKCRGWQNKIRLQEEANDCYSLPKPKGRTINQSIFLHSPSIHVPPLFIITFLLSLLLDPTPFPLSITDSPMCPSFPFLWIYLPYLRAMVKLLLYWAPTVHHTIRPHSLVTFIDRMEFNLINNLLWISLMKYRIGDFNLE